MESWYVRQANVVIKRVAGRQIGSVVNFECGFGPSGLPHIGTVAEVIRTRMVMNAFNYLTQNRYDARLILFADDLDALRKVPDTIPVDRRVEMESYIGVSVCDIPDPWGTSESYSAHNVRELVKLLETCGVERDQYDLRNASTIYRSGGFDEILTELLARHEDIKSIVTHDYSAERRETYFPFLPIINGRVHQDVINPRVVSADAFEWSDISGETHITSVLGGSVKCQWKLDWPMRWIANDIDFEMHGKDLIGSAQVGKRICQIMGKENPVIFQYELFLDEKNNKISKSKGNGLEVQEWLRYAPLSSFCYFLSKDPVKSRSLFWGAIPSSVDMMAKDLEKANIEGVEFGSSLWTIVDSRSLESIPISYSMLLNLVAIANTEDPDVLWKYINRYRPEIVRGNSLYVQAMIDGAILYYKNYVLPEKVYRKPNQREVEMLMAVRETLGGSDMRNEIYEVGKRYYGENNLRIFFKTIYEILLGQDSGPQISQFIEIVGEDEMKRMIDDKIIEENENDLTFK